MGDTKFSGAFDVAGDQAREWLRLPANPNGRTNADVQPARLLMFAEPWVNVHAGDLTRRPADSRASGSLTLPRVGHVGRRDADPSAVRVRTVSVHGPVKERDVWPPNHWLSGRSGMGRSGRSSSSVEAERRTQSGGYTIGHDRTCRGSARRAVALPVSRRRPSPSTDSSSSGSRVTPFEKAGPVSCPDHTTHRDRPRRRYDLRHSATADSTRSGRSGSGRGSGSGSLTSGWTCRSATRRCTRQ